MKRSNILCIALAAANIAVFLLSFSELEKPRLEVRVPKIDKNEKALPLPRNSIVFRPEGEYPRPPAQEAIKPAPEPITVTIPDERVDSTTMVFLGSMTSPEGRISYFFKNRMTNRVYSSSAAENGVKIVSQTEKEFVLEIDGAKYKVIR